MGLEAECLCTWGADAVSVKALLEARELVVRGALRRRVAFSQIQQIRVQGDALAFTYQGEEVLLALGERAAARWCKVILAPPVTLAQKLGITPDSYVWNLGEANDRALETALASAKGLRSNPVDLIVAAIDSMADLATVLRKTAPQLAKGVPLWLVYPKGKGHAVSESTIRSAARDIGLIDTKVASVSSVYTALRFIQRK